MKHKKLFISLTAVFTVIISLIIFFMIWFWGDKYEDGASFDGFGSFSSEIKIPGLKDGACPQGISTYYANYTVKDEDDKDVVKSQTYFFISAYLKNAPSRIYVVGQETGEVGYVTLKNEDGTDYTGHCGGLATNGYFLWVASDDTVFVATKKNPNQVDNIGTDIIEKAAEHGSIQFTTSFKANCRASFLYYYDTDLGGSRIPSSSDSLYIGEFYRNGSHETDDRHHITTPNGDKNTAFAYEYSASTSTEFGLSTKSGAKDEKNRDVPAIQKIFSITDEIQGFARVGNGLVLSQSYGLKNSRLYYYRFNWSSSTSSDNSYESYTSIAKDDENRKNLYSDGFYYDGAKTVNGAPFRDTSVRIYYIDSNCLINDYSIPSMSEGLCTLNNRVYVLFESGANKYKYFVRQTLKNVYSFIPRRR